MLLVLYTRLPISETHLTLLLDRSARTAEALAALLAYELGSGATTALQLRTMVHCLMIYVATKPGIGAGNCRQAVLSSNLIP